MADASGFAGRGKPQGGQTQQGGGGGAARKVTPLRPVSIKMLTTAEHVGDGALLVNKREVNQVIIAGQIVAHDNSQGGMATGKFNGYVLHDGSAKMLVKQWFDQTQGAQAPYPIDTYIRFVGTVKIYKGEAQVTGQATPLNNINEFLYHKMDIVSTHLRLHKGGRDLDAKDQQASPARTSAGNFGVPPPAFGAPPPARGAYGQPQAAPQQYAAAPRGGNCEDALTSFFGAQPPNNVVSMAECLDGVKAMGYSMTDVRTAIGKLILGGAVLEHPNGYSLPM